jgi:hypothetical protein
MLQEAARLLPGFSEDLTHATLGVGVQAYDGLFSRVFTFFYDVLHLSSGRDKLLALFQNACKLQHARLPAGSEDALGLLGAHDSISSSRKAFRFLKWVREVYKVRASALAVLRIPLVPFARAWRGIPTGAPRPRPLRGGVPGRGHRAQRAGGVRRARHHRPLVLVLLLPSGQSAALAARAEPAIS